MKRFIIDVNYQRKTHVDRQGWQKKHCSRNTYGQHMHAKCILLIYIIIIIIICWKPFPSCIIRIWTRSLFWSWIVQSPPPASLNTLRSKEENRLSQQVNMMLEKTDCVHPTKTGLLKCM